MAENEIEISELELADELLKDMVFPVETATDTKAATLLQLKKWIGSGLPIGTIVPAVGKISDSRFTLLDGKTLAKNGAYREFCEKVVEQVQAGNWFACSQEEYDADLLAYGQCGRFVVENDYVRIPTITRFIGATINLSEFGKSFAQSLPQHTHTRGTMNITGGPIHINAYGPGNITSGAFKTVATGASHNDSGGTGVDISFNAANAWTGSTSGASDGTYQSGAKVQPDHVKYPYYMVIGSEGQREDIAVDINQVYEDLELRATKEDIEKNVPVGSIIISASNSNLDGFLICNGAAISRETYSNLFAAIGTTYGSGDGSTTFNVPNLTDKFIQGSGTAGSVKNAGLPNITGAFSSAKQLNVNFNFATTQGAFYSRGQFGESNSIIVPSASSSNHQALAGFDASRSSPIYGNSSSVQPPALTMRYYIKY